MSTQYGGYMGKVLKINLSNKEICEYPWSDRDRELYLGGKIMAAKILYDNIEKGTDPYSEENLLVITTTPLMGSGAPSSSRFNISTLSPQTGFIGSSNNGGNFGMMLKKAGYDGLIISGIAESPTWIEIKDDKISFHTADDLWGKTTSETQAALEKRDGKIVIGPAGENLVKYASIVSDERISGRTGVGAVMGSKKLKAVVVNGTHSVNIFKKEKKKKMFLKWVNTLKTHPLTGEQLPKYGTAGLVKGMNSHNILAARNYSKGKFEEFESISGENLAENHLVKNKGCITCPIQCGRVVEVHGKEVKGPELETLGLLGPNLENNNLELIIEWGNLLDELGMDTISAGGSISFAMELQEKGLWDCGLEFGKVDNITQLIKDIAYRKGIGDVLAEGSKRMSERFGGKEFSIHSKGLELAAYEPRGAVGQGLGYAVANRGGCHINAGYMVILEGLGLDIDSQTIKSKAALTIMFQNLMEAVSAGGSCIFTLYAVFPGYLIKKPDALITRIVNKVLVNSGGVVKLINNISGKMLPVNLSLIPYSSAIKLVTGMNMTFGKFKEIGDRGYTLERLFNLKMGLSRSDDSLPKRLVKELQDSNNPNSKVPLEELLNDYYRLRGWNEDGIPSEKRLNKLGL